MLIRSYRALTDLADSLFGLKLHFSTFIMHPPTPRASWDISLPPSPPSGILIPHKIVYMYCMYICSTHKFFFFFPRTCFTPHVGIITLLKMCDLNHRENMFQCWGLLVISKPHVSCLNPFIRPILLKGFSFTTVLSFLRHRFPLTSRMARIWLIDDRTTSIFNPESLCRVIVLAFICWFSTLTGLYQIYSIYKAHARLDCKDAKRYLIPAWFQNPVTLLNKMNTAKGNYQSLNSSEGALGIGGCQMRISSKVSGVVLQRRMRCSR